MTFSIGGLSSVLDGKYRLDDRLGEGAAGVVYRATHLGLKKVFALKLLKPGSALDPFSVARFQREAEALGRLQHPHIVGVTDSGIDPGTGAPYLVMELLDGEPLAELCRTAGPLPLERVLPILDAIAAAVDAAHAEGILHRDLKPGNILLCGEDGGAPAVKVLDFGLAEIAGAPLPLPGPPSGAEADGRLTATGDLLGTPLYVAPEVIRGGRASRASDLYSLGVIAYEMLAGRPPFEGSAREVLARHLEREPPRGAFSDAVWSVLRDCLAKDPALRPATAGEAVRRLLAAAGRERRARWLRAEAPRRALLSIFLAAAVPVAGLLVSSGLPAAERWAYDLRVRTAQARAPDPRILLITLDERSTPFSDRGDEIGGKLERIFTAGARGVAIDVVLPEQWSKSIAFSDLVLRHPESLTLAAFSKPDGTVAGSQSVAGLTAAALGSGKAESLFGFVNLDEDSDGVIRHGRIRFRDRAGNERPSWAARAAETAFPLRANDRKGFWIDHRIDPAGFDRISWREIPGALAERPWIFRNRLVLVGIQGEGDDVHRIPRRAGRQEKVSGLMLQALQVATLAAGMPLREAPRPPFLALAALWTALASAAALLVRRPGPALAILLGGLLLYIALSMTAFQRTGLLWPMTPLLLPSLIALALAVILRRALSPIPRNEAT
ncbi:MAG: protein kinase domain-containing protein [Thermoanaerobaculia bacterium]